MGRNWIRLVWIRTMNASGETSENFPNKTLTNKTVNTDTAPVVCGVVERALPVFLFSIPAQKEQTASLPC